MRASIRIAGALWLAMLGLLLAAPGAGAYVYWGDAGMGTIGRAANDGSHVARDFVSTPGGLDALAVDAGHIYWAGYVAHAIGRASISGTSVEPEFIKLPYAPTGVAIDASHVYWAAESRIGRANLDGTAPKPEFIKQNVGSPCGLAVDSGHLYWAWGNSGPGYIERAPLNGSTVEYEFVKMSPVEAICGVAVNTSNVFWADNGLGAGNNIGRANVLTGGGVDVSFLGAALGPCGLAVFESKIYWANSGTATIARANTDGSGVEYEYIHTGAEPNRVCSVAVDGLAPPPEPPPADTTPPQTKIVKGPGGKLAKGRARFTFTSSEAGSGFRCKLDRKKATVCRSPRRYSHLGPGHHAFEVWATDAAGNEDPTPARRRFRVPG